MHPPFAPGQLARQSFFLDTNNNAILSFLDFTGSEHWAIHSVASSLQFSLEHTVLVKWLFSLDLILLLLFQGPKYVQHN